MTNETMSASRALKLLVKAAAPLEQLAIWRYAVSGDVAGKVRAWKAPRKETPEIEALAQAIAQCGNDVDDLAPLLARTMPEELEALRLRVKVFEAALTSSTEEISWPTESRLVLVHLFKAHPPKPPASRPKAKG